MALRLKEFCQLHGGNSSRMLKIGTLPGQDFVSIQTVDALCYLAFARNFPHPVGSVEEVKQVLRDQDLDVLEGVSAGGNTCFTIVPHSDLLEDFSF